jgi:hypothetical protein
MVGFQELGAALLAVIPLFFMVYFVILARRAVRALEKIAQKS